MCRLRSSNNSNNGQEQPRDDCGKWTKQSSPQADLPQVTVQLSTDLPFKTRLSAIEGWPNVSEATILAEARRSQREALPNIDAALQAAEQLPSDLSMSARVQALCAKGFSASLAAAAAVNLRV